jgi:hypothetical protein
MPSLVLRILTPILKQRGTEYGYFLILDKLS